jgi:putative ABC transport system ATP-binding protein
VAGGDKPQSSAAVICVRQMFKVYIMGGQEVRALDGVDLDVFPGEYAAIMGPSGSGKSTLMHMIGCLNVPTSGSYKLDGIEVADMDEVELAHIRNQKIGFVFQGFNLLSRTTALENVMLPMVYGKVKDMEERATRALERVGLGDRLNHNPNELSGGQQQRVAIARAIATSPKLLLADEPTGNLSSMQSEEIMQIFRELNDEGSTIVMVTHEPDIAHHCKRVLKLRDGRMVDDELVTTRLDPKVEIARMTAEQNAPRAARVTPVSGVPA